jgi:hypothetical protein
MLSRASMSAPSSSSAHHIHVSAPSGHMQRGAAFDAKDR